MRIRTWIICTFPTLPVAALATAGPATCSPGPARLTTAIQAQDEKPPAKGAKPQENGREEEKAAPRAKRPQENGKAQEEHNAGKLEKKQEPPSRQANAPEGRPEERAPETRTEQSQHRAQATQARAHYELRSQDTMKLRQHFQSRLSSVDRSHRPRLMVGGYIPRESVTYIEPVPVEIIQVLPPPPPGLIVGYWDGYCVVYDPNTLEIVYVIDLLE